MGTGDGDGGIRRKGEFCWVARKGKIGKEKWERHVELGRRWGGEFSGRDDRVRRESEREAELNRERKV